MLAIGRGGGTGAVRFAEVEDLKGDIVRHGANEGLVEGVILDVIDDRGMMGKGAGGFKGLVAFGVRGQIPTRQSA